jgi:hypothetical protein
MSPSTRREFFRQSAYLAGVVALVPSVLSTLTACHDTPSAPGVQTTIDFSTDAGAINFGYALSQLESDMYYRIYTNPYAGMLLTEKSSFQSYYSATYSIGTAVKKMSIHRITDSMLFDYSTVNFYERASSLGAARTVAEATANGYAAAQARATSSDTVTLLSTWTTGAVNRATAVRAMLGLGAFTPTAMTPAEVLAVLEPYYVTRITLVDTGATT